MEIERIRQHLMQQRTQLLARYRDELERADEELSSHEIETVERATEQWDAQVLSTLSDTDARALSQIVAALRRVEEGSYGKCTSCDEPIAEARLHAMPEAACCIKCAQERLAG